MNSLHQMIREYAYELWDCAGRPEGRSEEFWFAAKADFIPKRGPSREQRLGAHVRRSLAHVAP